MPHLVIKDAFPNFEEIKKEILGTDKNAHRAQRGGNNGHSVKWFFDHELPMTSAAMHAVANIHMYKFTENKEINLNDLAFEYQFIEYNTPEDQYDWHIDGVPSKDGSKSRRMTIALNMSTKYEDFQGDGFQLSTVTGFMDNENKSRVAATNFALALVADEVEVLSHKNSIVIFNPDTIHRASPILSGTRQLLTVWVKW